MENDLPPVGSAGAAAGAARTVDRLAHDLGALATVFDATAVGTGVWDRSQRLVYANPVLCSLLGRSSDELLGRRLTDLVVSDDVEPVAAKLRDLWGGRRNYVECDLRATPRDGDERALRAYLAAVYAADREPAYLISQVYSLAGPEPHDVRIRQLVKHVPAMLWLTDRDGMPRLGNRACFDFVGVHQPAGSIGQEWHDAVHPSDLDAAEPKLADSVARHEPFSFVARSRRQDGDWRWLHHRAEPIFGPDGAFEGYAGASIDVTELERERRDAFEAQRLLADLAAAGPLAVARADAEGNVVYVNDRWSDLLGDHESRLSGQRWHDLIAPEYLDRLIAAAVESIETRRPFELRVRARHPNPPGTAPREFWGELRAAPIFTADGRHSGFAAALIDVSDAVDASQQADRLAQVIDASSDLVVLADPSGAVTYANGAAVERLGVRTSGEGDDQTYLWDLLEPESRDLFYDVVEPAIRADGVWRGDLTLVGRDGTAVPVSALLLGHLDELGRIDSISAVARDITDLKDAEQRLRHLATHDTLTGLPNRTLLYDRLEQALTRFQRLAHGVALFYCDLDRFKPINDEQGHAAGDLVLQTIARRIREVVRATDTAARVGGDEFVVLVEGIDDPELLRVLGARLVAAVNRPIRLGDRTAEVGVSIGLVQAAPGRDDVDSLMRLADRAMYRAKAAGRGRVEVLEALEDPS